MTSSPRSDLLLFVDRLAAQSRLPDEEQSAILDLPCHVVEISRRRDLVQSYDCPSVAFLVTSGLVGRYVQLPDGSRQYTAFHLPGDMVDLHSTVRPFRAGGLHALLDTTVLRVYHSELQKLSSRYPAIALAFWRDCMLDAAILLEWTVNVGRRDARGRIAHLICEMSIRTSPDRSPQMRFNLALTQEQIGDALALTSVHVNRSLKRLEPIVSHKAGHVVIHDWTALAQAADFDPSYLTAGTLQMDRHP